ncbi:hypothetical protein O0I10_008748 [Lichtheimia ornata]|uniref:Succinate dehydrogenase assembly factor 2, mitochondrial n=1 Tax=Lichtheimia ornata TaxID=688661 RepID=A0AAD7UY14_9FUNG|nr:uncharacterized protein O0I10_008748 [Lichtheimia ornata]KAJ8655659.1 hypothetical protein O0I10_008748 [Lichtheimia ornata]
MNLAHSLRGIAQRGGMLCMQHSTRNIRCLSTTTLLRTRKSEDPYPDLGIRHAPQMELETPYPNLPPIPRPNESIDKKRARLRYQSRKRGILETDLLLSTFATEHLEGFTMEQLEQYDKLLDEPDWDIFYYATDKKTIPDRLQDNQVLKMIREHAKNESRIILRMPDLEASKGSSKNTSE